MQHDRTAVNLSEEGPTELEQRDAMVELAFTSDPDGLKAAYDAHGGLVYRFCARALGPHAAQDVTQEVFLTAWRKRDTFDPARGSLAGWLLGIARFRVLGAIRSAGNQAAPVRHPRGAAPAALDPTQPDEIDVLADRLLVTEVLRALPDRAATAIALSYIRGLSHQEVADHMDVPLGTVKSDIRRGLDRLHHALGGAAHD